MSSDAEAAAAGGKKGEKGDNGMPVFSESSSSTMTYARENWPTGLRILELIFAIFCIGLVVDPLNYGRLPNNNIHHVAMIFTAFAGYVIINSVILLGRMGGETLGWKTSAAFSLVGAIVFTAAGGVIIYDWSRYMYNHIFHPSKHYMDMMISSGIFSIFNAFIFLVDAVFTYREEP